MDLSYGGATKQKLVNFNVRLDGCNVDTTSTESEQRTDYESEIEDRIWSVVPIVRMGY